LARAERAAREILRRQIEDRDEELLALAHEVREAWRETWGRESPMRLESLGRAGRHVDRQTEKA